MTNMKKTIRTPKASAWLLFWAICFFALPSSAQTTITKWEFEGTSITTVAPFTATPSTGTGTAMLTLGTMTASSAGGVAPSAGGAWNTTIYPNAGAGNKTAGAQFAVSTVGRTNIEIRFDLRCSNTANNTVVLQYSTTGAAPFTDAATFTFTPTAGTTGGTWNVVTATPAATPPAQAIAAGLSRKFIFTGITALENNPNAVFRIVSAFDPTTGNYRPAQSTNTYASGGTMRFDNVEILGVAAACVEPTTSATTAVLTPGSTSMNITWTNGSGANRIVVMKAVSAVTGTPTDGTAYTANTVFGSGSTVAAGEFVVFNGSGSSVNVTGLTTGVQYCVSIFESACTPIDYKITTPATGCATTTAPTAPPTIIAAATTTPYIRITSPVAISGVISDPTDPARTLGLNMTVADTDTPIATLTGTVTSSNLAVVAAAGLSLTGTGTANWNLKITPLAVGYSTITVTVNDGGNTSTLVINYAASAASTTPTTTRYHTESSDASTTVAVDANYMFVGDDEQNKIFLYNRQNSGQRLYEFDYAAILGLTDLSGGIPREIDLEASVKVGSRIYWLASHSNRSTGAARPNRYRIFATDIVGTGASATLTYVGRYDNLRTDLQTWDATNAHGLGANFFGLTASSAIGVIPEANDGSGFNIEGLVMAPGSTTTGYIAFRAPVIPATARTKGLIIPINLSALVTGNPTLAGTATFGTPIQLNLGGRGIRSIDKNAADEYLIMAGPVSNTPTAPLANDFKLFQWNGITTTPTALGANLTGLNPEGIVEVPNPLTPTSQIQIISDNGDDIFYADAIIGKDLTENRFKKFRSDIVTPTDIKFVWQVQGFGTSVAITTSTTVEAIVIAVYQAAGQLGGFFIQEEDVDADGNPLTSDGIFVFSSTPVVIGQKVRVTGTPTDFFLASQIASSPTVTILSSGNPIPTPATVTLPLANAADYERYEGMLVNFTQELTVTEIYKLGRANEVTLSANGRIKLFTHISTPDAAAYLLHKDFIKRNTIRLDDPSRNQNLDPIIFPQPLGLSAANTLRGGYTTTTMSGVMYESTAYSGDVNNYRVFPTTAAPNAGVINFVAASNPRPTTSPASTAGTLRVATSNILNYFTTLQNAGNVCGPTGDQPCRGADNAAEFTRQRAKTMQMLNNLNADIIGLLEVENNGYGATSAIQDIVNGLNALSAPGTWAFVNPGIGTYLGNDVIKVAMIYKPAVVTIVGTPVTNNTGSFANFNRQPLTVSFKQNSNNEIITVCINHLKSKGSVAATGNPLDADQLDGQGNSNAIRTSAANQLAIWLGTNPTGLATPDPDILIIGDLNSYAKEDPIKAIEDRGYTNLLFNFGGDDAYSYVFDGEWGYLDHALATPCLTSQTVMAQDFHINSDEPLILDYNREFKSAGQIISLYAPDMYRTSDHDPVVMAFALGTPEINITQGVTPLPSGTSSVDFGTTTVGTSIVRTITISNTGTGVLNLTSLTVPAGYAVLTSLPATLAAGASINVEIRLNAASPGTFGGSLILVSNDCDETNYNVSLIGTVIAYAPIVPPTAPSYLIATAVDTRSIKLRWNDSNSDETGYEIYRSTDGTNFTPLTITAPYLTAECVYIDTMALLSDKAYYYIVRAAKGSSRSPYTNSAYDYTYPKVPTVLSISNACLASNGTIVMTGTHTTNAYRWYNTNDEANGIKGSDGSWYESPTFTTDNLQTSRTYYVTARGNRYESTPRLAVTVTVLPRPTATLNTAGATNIYACGNSTVLTATPFAGMAYEWLLNGVLVSTTSVPTFTATASGFYTLRLRNTVSGCASLNDASVTVKLNHQPKPSIIEGKNVAYCKSGVITAKAVKDATAYVWSKDGAVIGTNMSQTITTSGTYTLTVTQYGCEGSVDINATITSFPTTLDLTSSATDICPNEKVTLTAPAIAGVSYEWYLNNKLFRVTNSNTITTTKGGDYTVVFTYENGCATTSSPLNINVYDVPKGEITIAGNKLSATIIGSGSFTTVRWFKNGTYVPAFDGQAMITPTENGMYSAEFTFATGCKSNAASIYFGVLSTEEEENTLSNTLIYPNPSKGIINVSLDKNIKGAVIITLSDNLGRVVMNQSFDTANGQISINIESMPTGMYVMTLNANDKTQTFKLIKE